MDRDSSIYELVNTFLCMGEGWRRRARREALSMEWMDAFCRVRFLEQRSRSFHNGIPDFRRFRAFYIINGF